MSIYDIRDTCQPRACVESHLPPLVIQVDQICNGTLVLKLALGPMASVDTGVVGSVMKLTGFQVENFRSVEDSGWIDVDDVTALIGINESGKTNLLLPLWKLHPAKDGEIDLVADAPRKRYNEIKNMEEKPVFITAHFQLSDDLVQQLIELTGASPGDLQVASVSRQLDGMYQIGFPKSEAVRSLPTAEVVPLLIEAQQALVSLEAASKAEEPLKGAMLAAIAEAIALVDGPDAEVSQTKLSLVNSTLENVATDVASKRSTIAPRYGQLVDDMDCLVAQVSKAVPHSIEAARQLVLSHLPTFVYYSNYGNLDSEIYLPHVIQNLERDDLGSREEAKARTLKVLFDFVGLKPEEILELGQDLPVRGPGQPNREPTDEEIERVAARKKEREILLQSAGNNLTDKFRDWWKQGTYRIRFNADGNHFRIWVSDDLRTEEIELEGRSTGLQWFLSFYLIFLVESADAHEDAILLLDEPGLSLHPLAQKDLSRFFENLSQTNQLLYTTHSPFLVDSNHLDQVRSVYIDKLGKTVVSPDLRASEDDPSQTKSIYAVHAAVGLTVSDIILQGCQPVIVEGTSDQFYLNGIKNYLVRNGLFTPKQELVFVPSGGVRGVSAVVSILTGKNEELPYVVLDSDHSGRDMAKKLQGGLYNEVNDRILMVGDYCSVPNAEVEDLLPTALLASIVDRLIRGDDEDFSDVVNDQEPIIDQIEAYADENEVELKQGWKVDLARRAKQRLLNAKDPLKGQAAHSEGWVALFSKFQDDAEAADTSTRQKSTVGTR